jgi:hypothetical protein
MADYGYKLYNYGATDYSAGVNSRVTNDKNTTVINMFKNTKEFKDVSNYRLMRGVPDFGSLVQFNPYETGYAAFIICGMPRFITALAKTNSEYNKLITNWQHIIEYEFKSFEGLQDMTADTIQIGDDLNSMNVINKVSYGGGNGSIEFTLTYDEKSGSPITKFAKLYLSGIKDPRSEVKTYHGLIRSNQMEPGFENEVFTFLYIATDNTMRDVEAAYLLIGCQLNSADTDMYNYTKGDINKREVQVKFNGYPIQSNEIDGVAKDMLNFLLSAKAGARQIIVNSDDFNYTGVDTVRKTLESYGGTSTSADRTANYTAGSFGTISSNVGL